MAAPRPLAGAVWIVSGGRPSDRSAWSAALSAAGAVVAITGDDQGWLLAQQGSVDLALTLPAGDLRAAEVAVQAALDRRGRLDGLLHLPPPWAPDPTPAALAVALAAAVGACRGLDRAALSHLGPGGSVVHLLGGAASAEARAVDGARAAWSAALATEAPEVKLWCGVGPTDPVAGAAWLAIGPEAAAPPRRGRLRRVAARLRALGPAPGSQR